VQSERKLNRTSHKTASGKEQGKAKAQGNRLSL